MICSFMNKFFNSLFQGAVAITLAALLPSCAMDAPFGDAGEGSLTLTTEIRGDIKKETRAIGADELASLREKCIVYIENSKGVIRKYKGLDNIPEDIKLKSGSYVAEAWSGDSVSASFDKKFYRGYQKFDIEEGRQTLTLHCNIANVLVSVDASSLDVNLNDMKITFSHSKGSLEFSESDFGVQKGYFMMPNADKDVAYRLEGTKLDGSKYVKEGVIENVKRAHEYCLKVSETERPVTEGGALIQITIVDIPVIDDEVEVFTAPAFRGVDFDLDSQMVNTQRNFTDTRVYIRGYFGLSSVVLNVSDNLSSLPNNVNILNGNVISQLAAKGITVERLISKDAAPSLDGGEVVVDEVYVTFSKAFLDALPESASEYVFSFEATDERHQSSTASFRIANSESAIESIPPVASVAAPDTNNDPMAVGARSATLQGAINDAESATNFGIMYRAQGSSAWNKVYASSAESAKARRVARRNARNAKISRSAASYFSVKLTGLAPATTYEYKSFCDGFENSQVMSFTTEGIFALPNASFEDWDTYSASTMLGTKNVIFPGQGSRSFWDSGNEGAATANMVLTNKSTDMAHSGSYSARLESKAAMGVLAAGNIFLGSYVKTDGTNGVLSFGRPYNGSHPSAVTFWANYRPASGVSIKSGSESLVGDLVSGGLDQGQVYVALVDQPIDIRTDPSNRKLFDANDSHVLAYGEVTWKDAFAPDGQLKQITIPFVYNNRAQTKRPTHIVIVASASKYGDFFSGAKGSVMYLDDFELVYE